MATTKPSRPKLVPLKDQALAAIKQAQLKLVTQTRAGSTRRRLMDAKISQAYREYRAGDYTKAAITARTAHI
jgi:hypothetical protein